MKIGVLVIATNKYMDFVPTLVDGIFKHFLPGEEVHVFVHTNMAMGETDRLHRIETKHLPWPHMSLDRYLIFFTNREAYKDMDYLFYVDADSRIIGDIGKEILNPLTAVTHFGYDWRTISYLNTLEKNPISTAYIDPNESVLYTCGGFQGGETKVFITACFEIAKMIGTDLRQGIIARFHDESYWNKFLNKHTRLVIRLGVDYAYPEPIPKAYQGRTKIEFIRKDRNVYQLGKEPDANKQVDLPQSETNFLGSQ